MMDSDHSEQESGSPVMVGTADSQRRHNSRSKRQKTRKDIQSAIPSSTEAGERLRARDESSEGSASPPPQRSRSPAKKKGCAKTSPIWNHCNTKEVNGKTMTFCNHCPNVCWDLKDSTSTALYHVKQHHYEKLSADELMVMTEKMKGKKTFI